MEVWEMKPENENLELVEKVHRPGRTRKMLRVRQFGTGE